MVTLFSHSACVISYAKRVSDNAESIIGLSMLLPSVMAQNTISYYVTHI